MIQFPMIERMIQNTMFIPKAYLNYHFLNIPDKASKFQMGIWDETIHFRECKYFTENSKWMEVEKMKINKSPSSENEES